MENVGKYEAMATETLNSVAEVLDASGMLLSGDKKSSTLRSISETLQTQALARIADLLEERNEIEKKIAAYRWGINFDHVNDGDGEDSGDGN